MQKKEALSRFSSIKPYGKSSYAYHSDLQLACHPQLERLAEYQLALVEYVVAQESGHRFPWRPDHQQDWRQPSCVECLD